jgi:hypothetical protein
VRTPLDQLVDWNNAAVALTRPEDGLRKLLPYFGAKLCKEAPGDTVSKRAPKLVVLLYDGGVDWTGCGWHVTDLQLVGMAP